MKKLLLAASCGLVLCGGMEASAQGTDKCANNHLLNNYLQQHPEYIPALHHRMNHIQAQDQLFQQSQLLGINPLAKTTATPYVIPVVFHVILTQAKLTQLGGDAGVKARMLTQLDALNKDFTGTNPDSTGIPAAFKPLYGKADIIFSPAHRTPSNTGTEGYEILVTTLSGFSANSGMSGLGSDCKTPSQGGLASWDPMRYYNIWVVDITEGGILGYAIPPSFNPEYGIDMGELGVVLDYGAFGKRTTVSQFFSPQTNDLGRTLTHETGHFFELEHVFGFNDNCPPTADFDDGIGDTPPQAKETFNSSSACPTFPRFDACTPSGNGIMFMNFMDYVDDRCMYLFTKGQVNRMRGQFAAGVPGGVIKSLSEHPEVLQWPVSVGNVPNDNRLNIYPNPNNGEFELAFTGAKDLQHISITNMMGQVVYTINADNSAINNYHIDLKGFSKGVYMVHCNFASGTVTKKIVLQ